MNINAVLENLSNETIELSGHLISLNGLISITLNLMPERSLAILFAPNHSGAELFFKIANENLYFHIDVFDSRINIK